MNRSVDIPESKAASRSLSISIIIILVGIVFSILAGLFAAGMQSTVAILLIITAVIAFMFTFNYLEWGTAAVIFVLYSQTYLILSERFGIVDVAQGLIMLLGFSMITRWFLDKKEIPNKWFRPLFFILFYCMIVLTSVLYAGNSTVALKVAIQTVKSGIFAYVITILIKNKEAFRLAIWALLVTGIILGSISVYQYFTGTYSNDYWGYAVSSFDNIVGRSNGYRMGGPVQDPNYFAQLMLVLVPLAVDRLWNEKNRILLLLAGWALAVSSLTVLLTYSRGGFLAMVSVLGLALVSFVNRHQLIRYLLVLSVVGLLLVNFLPSQFVERMATLTDLIPSLSGTNINTTIDYSIRGRTSETIVALQMFADHPILGVGVGNYPLLYQKYSQRLGIDLRSEIREPHNLYLEVASETGLLGIFSFGLLLWVILKSMWEAQKALVKIGEIATANMLSAFSFGFIGYLIAALFIHSAFPRNFWVLAGIALAIPRIVDSEIELDGEKKYQLFHQMLSKTQPR